ncbi:phosphoglucosamine mutase [Kangiella koreensis]|uniref:Phosphoglucosamine mutase n=1 Tax=Kangiella koreensis (strain DSM 16069 / JCM 12317 / KCTC 12182 / SW-125) TaxID=523791 RepID=C7R8K9_KANKD|nr:phosphoglucosamine mutase [Kangiella koreensis]ACV27774.1 phosphoglucosamine mutase [Kangiella koreensis DSM 16069]
MSERKYFGTDGIRGTVGDFPITPEFVLKLGWAAGKVLGKKGKIVIGKDTRISGYMFESVLEAGLTAAGVSSFLVGPMPTPAIAYLTRTFRADAGIVISASHNPFQDNGIKFFSAAGTKLPDSVELEIEALLEQEMTSLPSEKLGKAYRIEDAAARYIEFCKASVPNDFNLDGMKIVLDCANGATYHIAPYVFKELGAKVIKTGVEPNGLNINHECGATHLEPLCKAVVEHQADLGIAFDGDGDRLMMVDANGTVINGDQLMFLMAYHLQQKGQLKGGVVGTLMTNMAIENALIELDIPFERSKVGDRYVMESLQKNDWLIGGESSGHLIHLDYNSTGDGIVAALQVLRVVREQEKGIGELVAKFPLFPQTMINIRVTDAKAVIADENLQRLAQEVDAELADQGRVLLRASGTEPLIRVMVEANDANLATKMAEKLAQKVRNIA